MINLEK